MEDFIVYLTIDSFWRIPDFQELCTVSGKLGLFRIIAHFMRNSPFYEGFFEFCETVLFMDHCGISGRFHNLRTLAQFLKDLAVSIG
jgi:hypothetical protein